jgi:hypothetical protein
LVNALEAAQGCHIKAVRFLLPSTLLGIEGELVILKSSSKKGYEVDLAEAYELEEQDEKVCPHLSECSLLDKAS